MASVAFQTYSLTVKFAFLLLNIDPFTCSDMGSVACVD